MGPRSSDSYGGAAFSTVRGAPSPKSGLSDAILSTPLLTVAEAVEQDRGRVHQSGFARSHGGVSLSRSAKALLACIHTFVQV